MTLALIAFSTIFLLIGSAGLLLFYREPMRRRLSEAISPPKEKTRPTISRMDQAGASIKAVVQPFEKVLPKSPTEVSQVEQRLIRAGLRGESTVRLFYGAKVLVPVSVCALAFVGGISHYFSAFSACLMTLGIGYLLPNLWLGRRVKQRQQKIRLGLPDFLDLMVVCIEAGLSLDYAVDRSVKELAAGQPEICDEFGLVSLEQRAGRPRSECWKNFANRVDLDVIRTLTSSVIQADQFGTSIARTLRVYSETLRTQRRQRIEELAAKTAVKLVFPLVLFVFPPLFIVALGPAALAMMDTVQKILH